MDCDVVAVGAVAKVSVTCRGFDPRTVQIFVWPKASTVPRLGVCI